VFTFADNSTQTFNTFVAVGSDYAQTASLTAYVKTGSNNTIVTCDGGADHGRPNGAYELIFEASYDDGIGNVSTSEILHLDANGSCAYSKDVRNAVGSINVWMYFTDGSDYSFREALPMQPENGGN
jgi:hypothetical protein